MSDALSLLLWLAFFATVAVVFVVTMLFLLDVAFAVAFWLVTKIADDRGVHDVFSDE